jgi:transmembrane sensor
MMPNEEHIRTAIAEQAGEWFVSHDEGPLDERDSEALAAWLKASPIHVEEFLRVSVIARDLRKIGAHPEFSLDAVISCARAENDTPVQPLWPRIIAPLSGISSRRWLTAALTMAAFVVLSLGLLPLWNLSPFTHVSAPSGAALLHFETRHGEQLTRRLRDNSVIHLNTDSAVTVQYGKAERLVTLTSGEALFEVAHEPDRSFRVVAGSAEVIAIGTRFDVRRGDDATTVTVIEGRVAVGASAMLDRSRESSNQDQPPRFVQVGASQQIRVATTEWPAAPMAVDVQRTTAWLHRQIMFEHEPLKRVAAEFNRYAPKPIEIASPALQELEISGVFATDDSEAFVAFLRSLDGVRVEVMAMRIRVSQD